MRRNPWAALQFATEWFAWIFGGLVILAILLFLLPWIVTAAVVIIALLAGIFVRVGRRSA